MGIKKLLFFLLVFLFTSFWVSSQSKFNDAIALPPGNFQSNYFLDSASNEMWFSFVADKARMTFSLMHAAGYPKSQNITIDSLVLYSKTSSGGINPVAFSIARNSNSDSLPAIQILSLVPGNTYYLELTKFNNRNSGYFNLSKIVLHPAIIPPQCNQLLCNIGSNLICNGDFETVPSWASGSCYADWSLTFPNNPPLPASIGYCISTQNMRYDICSLGISGDQTDFYIISNYMWAGFQNTAEHGSYFMGIDCPSQACAECSTTDIAGDIWTPDYTGFAWQDSIAVDSGVNYQFSCWLEDLDTSTLISYPGATVEIVINYDTIFSDVISYGNGYGSWQQITYCWTPIDTILRIQILGIGNADNDGYDFGIDNISLFKKDDSTLTLNLTNTSGTCIGSALVLPSGGYPPYTYNWTTSPVQTNQQATGLQAGSYTVIVTDSIGCQSAASVNIAGLSDSINSTSATCCNCTNGVARVYAFGGASPYTYLWSNGFTGNIISGLSYGIYAVMITDSLGCMHSDSVLVLSSFPVSISQKNVSCPGGDNGSASITVSGNYSYNWLPNGGTQNTATGLTVGTYTVTITNLDTNYCVESFTITISNGTSNLGINVSNLTAACPIRLNMIASAYGGTPPYTYNWEPYGGSGPSYDTVVSCGIDAPVWVVVTDSNGCSATSSNLIFDTPPKITSLTDGGCPNDATFTILSLNFCPYSLFDYYSINGANQYTDRFDSLSAGVFVIGVTDQSGCTADTVLILTNMTVTMNVISNVSCYGGDNGSVSLSATGGASPYQYEWSSNYDGSASSLSAGTYTVIVVDSKGCGITETITITQPPEMVVSTTVTPSCNGVNNGKAITSVSGGVSPYTYSWSDGATTSSISSLSAGTYIVNIKDHNNCNAASSVTITQPNSLNASVIIIANVGCNGGNNGSDSVSVSGGTSPYTYSWSGGRGTYANATGLVAGTYTVNVTDSNGCTASASVTITQPPAIIPTITEYSGVKCNGDSDAVLFVSASGGSGFYEYQWSNASSQTNSLATGLSIGTYTVIVTDNNGCTGTAFEIITQPPPLIITADSINATNGNCNGSAWVIVNGGTNPYTYLWTGGLTTDTIANQCVNYYCCTITDANGCIDSACVNIDASTGTGQLTIENGQLTIYPNPNDGIFTIALGLSELVSESQPVIEIYNVLGEQVYYATLNLPAGAQGDNVINLTDKASGMYFYRVINEDGSLVGEGKIVIIHN